MDGANPGQPVPGVSVFFFFLHCESRILSLLNSVSNTLRIHARTNLLSYRSIIFDTVGPPPNSNTISFAFPLLIFLDIFLFLLPYNKYPLKSRAPLQASRVSRDIARPVLSVDTKPLYQI